MTGEDECLRESFLTSNAVLRKALAYACKDLAGPTASADAGVALMLCYVMQASEEVLPSTPSCASPSGCAMA